MVRKGTKIVLTNPQTTIFEIGLRGVVVGRTWDGAYEVVFGGCTQYIRRDEFETLKDYNLPLSKKIDRKIKQIYSRQYRKTGHAYFG